MDRPVLVGQRRNCGYWLASRPHRAEVTCRKCECEITMGRYRKRPAGDYDHHRSLRHRKGASAICSCQYAGSTPSKLSTCTVDGLQFTQTGLYVGFTHPGGGSVCWGVGLGLGVGSASLRQNMLFPSKLIGISVYRYIGILIPVRQQESSRRPRWGER